MAVKRSTKRHARLARAKAVKDKAVEPMTDRLSELERQILSFHNYTVTGSRSQQKNDADVALFEQNISDFLRKSCQQELSQRVACNRLRALLTKLSQSGVIAATLYRRGILHHQNLPAKFATEIRCRMRVLKQQESKTLRQFGGLRERVTRSESSMLGEAAPPFKSLDIRAPTRSPKPRLRSASLNANQESTVNNLAYECCNTEIITQPVGDHPDNGCESDLSSACCLSSNTESTNHFGSDCAGHPARSPDTPEQQPLAKHSVSSSGTQTTDESGIVDTRLHKYYRADQEAWQKREKVLQVKLADLENRRDLAEFHESLTKHISTKEETHEAFLMSQLHLLNDELRENEMRIHDLEETVDFYGISKGQRFIKTREEIETAIDSFCARLDTFVNVPHCSLVKSEKWSPPTDALMELCMFVVGNVDALQLQEFLVRSTERSVATLLASLLTAAVVSWLLIQPLTAPSMSNSMEFDVLLLYRSLIKKQSGPDAIRALDLKAHKIWFENHGREALQQKVRHWAIDFADIILPLISIDNEDFVTLTGLVREVFEEAAKLKVVATFSAHTVQVHMPQPGDAFESHLMYNLELTRTQAGRSEVAMCISPLFLALPQEEPCFDPCSFVYGSRESLEKMNGTEQLLKTSSVLVCG